MSSLPDSSALRILIAGEGRSPIHEEAWQQGLEAAGCRVERFDWGHRFRSGSTLRSLILRAQNQLLLGPALVALNADLVNRVTASKPDVLLLYRPTHVFPSALRMIREIAPKTLIVSYNNDDPFSQRAPPHLWRYYLGGAELADLALVYRKKNIDELHAAGAQRVELVRSYFIPELHHPVDLTASDREKYEADIVFVGHYEPDGRIDLLAAVAQAFPRLRLFGPDWDRAADYSALQRFRPIRALSPEEYGKAIQCAKIALVFFSGLNNDTYTRRVFEIPAMRTFMLSAYSTEMESLFRPGIDADYFRGKDELIAKIKYYIANDNERTKLAASGALRVHQEGHDVYSRMRQVLYLIREAKRQS